MQHQSRVPGTRLIPSIPPLREGNIRSNLSSITTRTADFDATRTSILASTTRGNLREICRSRRCDNTSVEVAFARHVDLFRNAAPTNSKLFPRSRADKIQMQLQELNIITKQHHELVSLAHHHPKIVAGTNYGDKMSTTQDSVDASYSENSSGESLSPGHLQAIGYSFMNHRQCC